MYVGIPKTTKGGYFSFVYIEENRDYNKPHSQCDRWKSPLEIFPNSGRMLWQGRITHVIGIKC